MKKRPIEKKNYQTVKKELEYFEHKGLIFAHQKDDMLSRYEIKSGINFIRVLLVIGALLLGIGVLSFVASNWMHMGKTAKFLLILFSIAGLNVAGLKWESVYPKTARALHYVGVLFFGAGIFLVGQMFNTGGEYQNDFLLWALGTLPIGYVLRDRILLVFSSLLLFIYVSTGFNFFDFYGFYGFAIPFEMFVIIPVLYLLNRHIQHSRVFLFSINTLSIQLLCILLLHWIVKDNNELMGAIILFAVGIFMLFIPAGEKIKPVFELQGHIIHSIMGIILTFSDAWEHTAFGESFSFVFSAMYALFVLFLIKRGSLFGIVVLCGLILRFYVDLSYDFLPKSMVFILGGAIFIGFGYYFERQRRKGGKNHVEN